MFEEEIAMEEKESSIVPLLMICALIACVLGGIGWLVWETMQKKDMTAAQGQTIIEEMLKAQGPGVVHFHTGLVVSSVDEKPYDPHYKLLEKLGYVKTKVGVNGALQVDLTPEGAALMKELGVEPTKNADKTEGYIVPLADRKLVEVSRVKMLGVNMAQVDYKWKWQPNKMGDQFDVNNKVLDTFKIWDRTTLIQKYGVDFYHAEPKVASLTFQRAEKGWQPYSPY